MKSTSPGRSRSSSSGWGSLTLSTRSACAHTSSASVAISAPAARKSSSLIEEPAPGVVLDDHGHVVDHELVDAVGRDRDAVLALLALARDPDGERWAVRPSPQPVGELAGCGHHVEAVDAR